MAKKKVSFTLLLSKFAARLKGKSDQASIGRQVVVRTYPKPYLWPKGKLPAISCSSSSSLAKHKWSRTSC